MTGSTNRHYDITQQHVLPQQPPLPAAAAAAAITTTTTTTTPKKPLLIHKLILEKYSGAFKMAIVSTYTCDFYVGCTFHTNMLCIS